MRSRVIRIAQLAALLAGALPSAPSQADEVTVSGDDPIITSTTSGLSPGDTLVADDETDIELDASGQAGVTIDTDNALHFDGAITAEDLDDVAGVVITHDVTGDIVNTGSIWLGDDEYELEDLDEDGDVDPDTNDNDVADEDEGVVHTGFSTGEDRTGLWLVDGVTLNGDVLNGIDSEDDDDDESGSIAVEGNNSFAIRIDGVINGDLLSVGSLSVYGDNSVALRIGDGDGETSVTGDVVVASATATGENSIAVEVADAIGGSLEVRGTIIATGYHSTGRPSDTFDYDEEDGIDYYELDADDKLQSGSAISIEANIDTGLLIRGVGFEDDMDDDHDGTSEDDEDADESDDNLTGSVYVYGGAPAINVTDGAVLGALDYDFSYNTLGLDNGDVFGFYNRGTIGAYGVFNDIAAIGVNVEEGAAITGGLLNDGTILASSYNADAYALRFDGGATEQIVNRNAITASVTSDSTTPDGYTSDDVAADDTAYAIYIGSGSDVASITNTSSISAYGVDTDANSDNEANATAIYDGSNTLTSIDNSGLIEAYVYTSDKNTDDDVDPVAAGDAIAIDTRSNTVGLTLTQTAAEVNEDDGVDADEDEEDDTDEAGDVSIVGDILLGSGDDVINLWAGTIEGDISFGVGADTFSIDGGASYSGRLFDSDGDLALTIANGSLYLTNDDGEEGQIDISSAHFGADSLVAFQLDTDADLSVLLNASGAISFEEGAEVLLLVPSTLPESGSVAFLSASGGLNASAIIGEVTTDGTSYLYNVSVDYAEGDANTLEATYVIKTPGELGLDRNQTAAFGSLLTALRLDEDASGAFAALSTAQDFFAAYENLMPSFASGAAELATTAIRQGQNATQNRLNATRLQSLDEVSVWAQEIAYSVTRTPPTRDGQAYKGDGFGIAFGVDGPLDNGALFGVSASFITSEVTEAGRIDGGEIASTFLQLGAYWGLAAGPFDIDVITGLGGGKMQSQRFVEIGDDFEAYSEADWWALEANASARVSAPMRLASWLVIAPQAELTYVALAEDGYSEDGGGVAIDYEAGEAFSQRLWLDGGIELRSVIQGQGQNRFSPRLYVGYRSNLIDEAGERSFRFVSGESSFTLVDDTVGEGGMLAGLGVDFTNGFSTVSLSYDGEFADQIERHSINATFRYRF